MLWMGWEGWERCSSSIHKCMLSVCTLCVERKKIIRSKVKDEEEEDDYENQRRHHHYRWRCCFRRRRRRDESMYTHLFDTLVTLIQIHECLKITNIPFERTNEWTIRNNKMNKTKFFRAESERRNREKPARKNNNGELGMIASVFGYIKLIRQCEFAAKQQSYRWSPSSEVWALINVRDMYLIL